MKNKIIIGTRGSKLALYQAHKVKETLTKSHPSLQVEIEIILTKGDKVLDVALSKIGDKGLFTKEIEVALLNKTIDIAVHSCKDLPTILPSGLQLGVVLERGEFRDALVSKNHKKLSELDENDIVATSSLRRQAALLGIKPNVQIKDIRGNVNTRLKKMEEGYCDAMIMAAAGLQRLGLDHYITEIIDAKEIMPAIAQGAIAIEVRENDPEVMEILEQINHQPTWIAILAERSFLRTLEGGCQVPLGCISEIEGTTITLSGFVASIDGKKQIKDTAIGSTKDPEACGIELAKKLINKGASIILNEIKKNS
ncbi:MAG: hydroxymethylbilane synthase [Prolixibacteraceae bacterium]|jgi:hydroxymethylbilane synthase|nr:hydroxymethylbilane synthase [Prolixibacteraceae bacterium]